MGATGGKNGANFQDKFKSEILVGICVSKD